MISVELRTLAALLRSGSTLRNALLEWTSSEPRVSVALDVVRRRVRLGAPVTDALSALRPVVGDDAKALRFIVTLGERTGADLSAMLEALAASIEERERVVGNAAAHVAGVRLSARMVGVLPLLFIPLTPVSRDALLDPWGVMLIAIGGGLTWLGMRWIARLVPAAPRALDDASLTALVAGAALAGGCSLRMTLDACAASGGPGLRRAHRLVRLGLSWPEAMARSRDPHLEQLGSHLATSLRRGLPVGDQLDAYRRMRAAADARAFEHTVRRAPVRMIVPLTTCVLPASAVLGAGPFVRSLLGI